MNTGYYTGKIKVVCADMGCFPVNAKSLEALACTVYDPYAWSDPEDAVETISYEEWVQRLNVMRGMKP